MKYLPMMSEDEIRYVCSVIPLQNSVEYFKRNPKSFAKIMPGFRAKSLNQEQASGVLFRSRNQPFISSFIEGYISYWLDKIVADTQKITEEGESKESALLQALIHCPFENNIEIFFKLIDEKHAKKYLLMVNASIKIIKDAGTKHERVQSQMDKKTTEISRLESELGHAQAEQNRTSQRLSECFDEITMLKRTNGDLQKLKEAIIAHEKSIENFKKKLQERDDYIKTLKTELSSAKDEQRLLEQEIREEFAKQQEAVRYQLDSARKPKCPKDIDEFRDYLGYNLENLGVSMNLDCYQLLKDYLIDVLFQGRPIIISKSTGLSLMKCISNTLVNTSTVPVLNFAPSIPERVIDVFLSQDKRIVCLDNFIGNYNETTLITTCDKYRDKIIFLTIPYDRTLCFVPDELMKYCHYINLNRIAAFLGNKELTEDPSVIDEVEAVVNPTTTDSRWSLVLKEILEELGVQGALCVYKSSFVVNESSLCRILAFDVLPYCADVLKIAPFNSSERLVKYAGNIGKCPYKDLFRSWFM